MEEIQTPTPSMIQRALAQILGKKKAADVPFDPEKHPAFRAAKERQEQLRSGVIPKSGRGSSGGTTPLPEGSYYLPHNGARQKQRFMRQTWAQFEKRCKKDSWYNTTRERLLDTVADEPDAEFAAMNIAMGAKLASDAKKEWLRKNPPPPNAPPMVEGTEWVDALNAALNSWEELHERTAAQAAADGAVL